MILEQTIDWFEYGYRIMGETLAQRTPLYIAAPNVGSSHRPAWIPTLHGGASSSACPATEDVSLPP